MSYICLGAATLCLEQWWHRVYFFLGSMNKKITVRDTMQKGYTYMLAEPVGRNFAADFKPQLSPKQMLSLGVFGGVYFDGYIHEYPKTWFAQAKISEDGKSNKDLNYFKVSASMPLKHWREKGWLHRDDPRGWFQWYCRYYMGRRHEDDVRQIKRWKNMRRHVSAIKNNCKPNDLACRKKQRQAVLHWAYDSRNL